MSDHTHHDSNCAVAGEQLCTLREAGRIARPSRPAHLSTVWRWALKGARGVRLETVVIGGSRFTSREAVARFVAALNAPRDKSGAPAPVCPGASQAAERLRKMGA